MSYTIYYHTACKGFTGRATQLIMILEEAGKPYTMLGADAYDGTPAFAAPFIRTPSGITIAQTAAIMMTLGEELGLAPKEPVLAAKAKQVELDAADILSETISKKLSENPERAKKWAAHVEKLLAGGYAVGSSLTYADFSLYMITESLANESEVIKAWRTKMEETKGVKGWKALGVPVLPPSK
uniref:Glutathione S-transferase C-terminal domain-containing protein n=1 Tax=Chromera velia CCMP2878 TaxID=1169474 RepID=A0A0G4HDR7_9ALVE|mmetsp:Transcript_40963/g.80811  ORF Transcript_40963/g.80811 Transcript_40963/m.80811 type:complete len:183 (-) Transcript_40963:350-898(-)|eukprot:Cvel_26415.t1-p1 / transcript=Cvel_26415.t1 / gene=Cvel_26415 / organism=Chromera_velia_CCMP2878 / gene_product=hypothetical protein / transcript_product=hypothetical protein / location=Cvel_scaffold3135:17710-18255(+) / protein_length=182 / sequence_SO=supercontig / SO=protein_coding / is_pseudo=false